MGPLQRTVEVKHLNILLLAALLSALSCAKGTPQEADQDSVQFYAGIDRVETKTVYGEESMDGSVLTQPIHWLSADRIRIWGDIARTKAGDAVCDYQVDTVSATDGRFARMDMFTGVDLRGLRWKNENARHNFVGIYPSPDASTDVTMDAADGTVTCVLPSVPDMTWKTAYEGVADMRYAYVYARASGMRARDNVPLLFRPAFTAFQFIVSRGEYNDVVINKFTLECTIASAPDNGIVGKITIPATGTVVGYSETAKSITVNMADKALAGDQTLDITVFTFPKDLSKLKITYEGTYDGGTFKKSLNFIDHHGDPTFFPGVDAYESGRKYRIKGLAFLLPEHEANGEGISWDQAIDVVAIGPTLIWDSDSSLSGSAAALVWANGVDLTGTGTDVNWIITHFEGEVGEGIHWEDDTHNY